MVDAFASLIDQDSDFVFNALDSESQASKRPNGVTTAENNINYRDEPAAFFFVLFGIVIEALNRRPGSDAEEAATNIPSLLSALKKILRPSVSGNAIYQEAVFAETMELLDRLSLTEGLDVQLILVSIARNLCLGHPSAKHEDSGDHLSEDIEQLFQLTRIIVLVLGSVLPNLAGHKTISQVELPEEAIVLIRASLVALVDVSDIFPSIIKTDLHASILHIFSIILGTGICQKQALPQALPMLKRFLQILIKETDSKAIKTLTNQLRGCLHRFRAILGHAQRRESDTSVPCAKNTLLAFTVVLTTASQVFPPNDPLITHVLDDILDCLQDLGLVKTAANCLRSLLLTSPKSPTDEAIVRYIFPRMAFFMTDNSISDPENARSSIAQAITSYAVSVSRDSEEGLKQGFAVLSVVMPLLTARASEEGQSIYKETAALFLELANGEMLPAFRGVVAKMEAEQRSFMEAILKEGAMGAKRRSNVTEKEDEPSIALKMSFGIG